MNVVDRFLRVACDGGSMNETVPGGQLNYIPLLVFTLYSKIAVLPTKKMRK